MSRLLLVGLPASGKTTFLGAFFHLLDEEDKCAYQISRLPSDMGQLNKIRETWSRCEQVPRTPRGAEVDAFFQIKSVSHTFDLSVPDNTGETFIQLLEDRKWDLKLADQVKSADGVILFVHSVNITRPDRLDSFTATARELAGKAGETVQTERVAVTETPFSYRGAPTQVLLTDLLQMISEKANKSLRLCVVVSAWDQVPRQCKSPKGYLKSQYPLLDQYISANLASYQAVVLGLSAQGGSLPEDAERLKKMAPLERVTLVSEESSTHDLTKLLEWFYE